MILKLVSETIGTFFLLLIVIGSGIMGENLTDNKAIILLANSTATFLGLTVLIWTFVPYSGSHFNPAVSIIMMLLGRLTKIETILFILCQVVGGIAGAMVANIIFDLSIISISENIRLTRGIFISEIIATFGLLNTILLVGKQRAELVATAVGMYIGAAYWFTSLTSEKTENFNSKDKQLYKEMYYKKFKMEKLKNIIIGFVFVPILGFTIFVLSSDDSDNNDWELRPFPL